MLYKIGAEIVLVVHFLFVVFVILSLFAIIIGKFRNWRWVRNRWFRIAHLSAIGIVVLQAWFGLICPLTTLEKHFRLKAGEVVYEESFMEHWLGMLLYYDLPPWIFLITYSVFGSLVLISWFWVRPNPFKFK